MNRDVIIQILPWILPPILGAIIGYVTNYIAIKMLFRPLREKRIFGIPIPFTPGIIPRQRHVLAESIGDMVADKLLTFSAFKTHLDSPGVRESIRSYVSGLTDTLLNRKLSFIKNDKVDLFLHFIEQFLSTTLKKLFQSHKVTDNINTLIRDIISDVLHKNTSEILVSFKIKQIISEYILPFLTRSNIKTWLSKEIAQWSKEHIKNNTPLEVLIPAEIIDETMRGFESFIPHLIRFLFEWLREDETKITLARQGRELIKNIFKKLNLFQQFFVSVGQYDKTLTEKMPEIVDDTLISLESAAKDPVNQRNFVRSSKKAIGDWLKKGVFEIFNNETINIDDIIQGLVEKVFSLLEGPGAGEFILNQVEEYISRNKDKSLKNFFESQIGVGEDDIIALVQHHSLVLLSKDETIEKLSQTLARLVASLISGLEEQPLRELLGLDQEMKDGIDDFLFDKILLVVESKLPDLITMLDVKTLVVNKINSLEIVDVEKLLLMVISQHLRWINVFGALLGAVIGFIQVFVNLFIR